MGKDRFVLDKAMDFVLEGLKDDDTHMGGCIIFAMFWPRINPYMQYIASHWSVA